MDNNELIELIGYQILSIRDSGATNMFDIDKVREIAQEQRFDELVTYIDTNKDDYVLAIFTGKVNL